MQQIPDVDNYDDDNHNHISINKDQNLEDALAISQMDGRTGWDGIGYLYRALYGANNNAAKVLPSYDQRQRLSDH